MGQAVADRYSTALQSLLATVCSYLGNHIVNVLLMSNIAGSESVNMKYIKYLVGDPEGKRKLARTGNGRVYTI